MSTMKFDYFAPASLEEALDLLAEKGEQARLLAGGTDLLIRIRQGLLRPAAVIGLKRIPGLERISFQAGQGLTIGATARLAEVAAHPAVRRRYPAVALAAQETANVQIRNMGTVVGNLCNAAPSADNAPSLLALGAELLLARKGRERSLPLESFFKGPGLTALEPGEMVTAVRVPPPPPHSGTSYQHISARGKVDISAVSVGVLLGVEGNRCRTVNIFLGAVAPIPLRAARAEKLLRGKALTPALAEKAGAEAAGEARPISDMRASAEYRRRMVAVLTKRALTEAYGRARQRP